MFVPKRVYDSPAGGGIRFLVERLWPRGMKKESLEITAWLKDVAPTTELRRWFGHDPSRWGEFRRRYFAELDARAETLEQLLQAGRKGEVVLLYSARDTEHNNAVALAQYLDRRLLGLPGTVRACLFDLDGVLTETASLHEKAWEQMFDDFLGARARETGQTFVPFGARDYDLYVDGKRREDGTRSFLASRGIELPEGAAGDPPAAETVHGLGGRKNEILLRLMREEGVHAFPGSVRYLRAVRGAGLGTAVVSSSENCRAALVAAGISEHFDARIDGLVAAEQHLAGKPSPDTFLAAARALHVPPGEAAVFEDALAGVAAGRAGHFGFVVGVDRANQADGLRRSGADVVVADLAELLDET